jgi:hypothetical protein
VEHKARSIHSHETAANWRRPTGRNAASPLATEKIKGFAGPSGDRGRYMQRMFITVALTAFLLFMLPAVVLAQVQPPEVPAPPEVQNILAWLTQEPPNYKAGILFGVLGLIGGLTTSYYLVGNVLPGTAGKKDIDQRDRELEEMQKRLEVYRGLLDAMTQTPPVQNPPAPPVSEARIHLYGELENALRDDLLEARRDLDREKRKQYLMALPLYAVLGAAAAMFFATDLLQALVIGAAGPAVIGSRGLKTNASDLNAEVAHLTAENAESKATTETVLRQEIRPAIQSMQQILATMLANQDAELGAQAQRPPELSPKITSLKDHTTQVQSGVDKIQQSLGL